MPKGKVTKKEAIEYLNAVCCTVFNRSFNTLSPANLGTLRTNLIIRKKYEEIDDNTYQRLLEIINER